MKFIKTPFFMRPVKELKAYQLFLGQSMWFFIIGIIFFVIKQVSDKTFTPKSFFTQSIDVIEDIGTGQSAASGKEFAASLL